MEDFRINGKGFIEKYGVIVEKVEGDLDIPKRKGNSFRDFSNENGVEARVTSNVIKVDKKEIILKCYLKTNHASDFNAKLESFQQVFENPGLQYLDVLKTKHTHKIFLPEGAKVTVSKWKSNLQLVKFDLKVLEPNPNDISYSMSLLFFGFNVPLYAANITLHNLDSGLDVETKQTDIEGQVVFYDLVPGNYRYTFEKASYTTFSENLSITDSSIEYIKNLY